MNQQEIFQNMTKGDWFWAVHPKKNTRLIVFADRIDNQVCEMNVELDDNANAHAIVAAVNHWSKLIGKGINPESVEVTNKGLTDLIKWVELTAMPILRSYGHDDEILPKGLDKWKEALTAAKL